MQSATNGFGKLLRLSTDAAYSMPINKNKKVAIKNRNFLKNDIIFIPITVVVYDVCVTV